MRKADILAGLRGKPVPFDAGGFEVHLRLLTADDRRELMLWYRENKAETGAAITLQNRLVALTIADPETGDQLLTEKDAALLPAVAVDAISKEVAARNGMKSGKDDEPAAE